MLLWGLAVGAAIGLVTGGGAGLVIGAVAGLLGGWWLSVIVRASIAVETAKLRRQIEAEVSARMERADPVSPTAAGSEAVGPPPVGAEAPFRPSFEASEAVAAPDVMAPRPPQASTPDMLDKVFKAAWSWLVGGNTIVRVGVVVLFVGLSFLVRYAAMAGLLPIELRLAAVGAAGVALLGVGFWRREARPEFGLVLQGAGVAVIYLTLFGAARLFSVIPSGLAFALMLVICCLGCALALLQNSQTLAAVSFVGGFAVPVLLGGEGSSVGLFGYYTVLNLAVLFISLWRAWRVVKLIGFFATFGVATVWGALAYRPDDYATSQAFLALFVVIYLLAAVLRPRLAVGAPARVVDTVLLFGPALVGFGLQVGLVRDNAYGSAFSALGFAALYIAMAAWLRRQPDRISRLLFEALLAIGVGFVTLAVPLGLGMRWTSAPWAIEGAAAVWIGLRQDRWPPRLFGLAMIALAGLIQVGTIGEFASSIGPLGPRTLGALVIAASALTVAWWLRRPTTNETPLGAAFGRVEAKLGEPMFFYGFAFWCLALIVEVTRGAHDALGQWTPVVPATLQPLVLMALFLASASAAAIVGYRWAWPVATWPGRAALPVMAVTLILEAAMGRHAPEFASLPFWLAGLGLHGWLLWRWDRDRGDRTDPPSRWLHAGGVWLMAGLLADGLWFAIDRAGLWTTSWATVSGLTATTLVLIGLTFWAGRTSADQKRRWPLRPHADSYLVLGAAPVAVLTYHGALLTALASRGDTAPLPYLPLLNPVDLACGLALAALLLWRRAIAQAASASPLRAITMSREATVAWAALALLVVNSVWLRAAHHLLGVAWSAEGMMSSPLVQAGVSILWTVVALSLMLLATRRRHRLMWLTGAGLLGAVVVKLLTVDLSNTSGGARIVAFIVVGVLMLVVGYFSPLPPRETRVVGAGE